MVLITIVTGAYKPTYNWGAPHCMLVYQRVYVLAAPVMAMFELTSHVCALNRRKFWSLGANLPRTMRIKACACSLSFAENEVLPTPMIYDNFPTKFIILGPQYASVPFEQTNMEPKYAGFTTNLRLNICKSAIDDRLRTTISVTFQQTHPI